MTYSTQSPSTIYGELLTQTENFFVGHLSSAIETAALAKLQRAFAGVEEEIMRSRTPGYMRMLTQSHRFVIPVRPGSSRPESADMPYQGGARLTRPETASKLGHLEVVKSPFVKSLIDEFEYPRPADDERAGHLETLRPSRNPAADDRYRSRRLTADRQFRRPSDEVPRVRQDSPRSSRPAADGEDRQGHTSSGAHEGTDGRFRPANGDRAATAQRQGCGHLQLRPRAAHRRRLPAARS